MQKPKFYVLGFNAPVSCLDTSKGNITGLWVARTAARWAELPLLCELASVESTFPVFVHSGKGEDFCSFFEFIVSQFSSVIRSCLTLQPHELQHARAPCPSPTPGVYSNSCPWTWWCHPITSSSVVPFSSWIHRLFTNPRNKVQLFPPFPSRWRCEIEWYGSAMSCLSAPQTQLQPEQVPTHMILALNNISVEILESLLKV